MDRNVDTRQRNAYRKGGRSELGEVKERMNIRMNIWWRTGSRGVNKR